MAAKWRLVRAALRPEAPVGAQNDVEGDIVLRSNAEPEAVAPVSVSRVAVMRERFLLELQRAQAVMLDVLWSDWEYDSE